MLRSRKAATIGLLLVAGLAIGYGVRVKTTEQEPQAGPSNLTHADGDESPRKFFHPAWQRTSGSVLPLSLRHSDQSDVEAVIRNLVDDPRARLEKEFQVPSGLKERVAFWVLIYSRYTSRMRVVHDRNNPFVIYGYIDFRPLYRMLGSSPSVDAKANGLEKIILKGLKAELREAIGLTNSGSLASEEKAQIQGFLSRIGALSAKDTEARLVEIRTQSGQADFFQQALYRSRNLLPHIESVFRRNSLPVALGRIPFVESSFNAHAYSKGGAMGIWQFMPETARQMIRGNNESDWADPLKQTASAARVLKLYRSVLPDWGTTVTSYNSGVGRVRKLVEKYHVKDVEGLLNIASSDGLGFAGKNFYCEFLAANIVEGYKEELFERPSEPADAAVVFRSAAPFAKEVCDSSGGLGL